MAGANRKIPTPQS